jgi:pimeloyl-ACP methyl ester carboxylesterase
MPTGLTVRTPALEIGYESHGEASGFPIVLLHGFPDDVCAWDAVAPPLMAAGYRVSRRLAPSSASRARGMRSPSGG